MKSLTAPLITAALLVVLLLGWTGWEKRRVEEKTRHEIRRTAETLFSAMQGSIQSNLRRGRGHKERIGEILKNVTESTELTHFEIRQDNEVITSAAAMPVPAITSPEGVLFERNSFWLWKTVQLMDHMPPHAAGSEQGHMGGRNADTDIDFSEKSQLIVMGLDAAPYFLEGKQTLQRIYLLAGTGMTAALILAAAWSFIIRNRQLSLQLERESIRAEHLSDLQLAGAGLAHETKNPLGLIRGMAQQISTTADCPQHLRDLSFDIMEQADIATARLGEFISFSRRRLPELETVNLQEVAGRICELMQYDARRLQVELRNDVPALPVQADPGMLAQILTNLISNALHACTDGAVIRIAAACRRHSAELRVCDTGAGIPADLLPEVFKPYVTGRTDGHGLGLAIVRRMVEDHGWRIKLESVEHRGTEVSIFDIPCTTGGGHLET